MAMGMGVDKDGSSYIKKAKIWFSNADIDCANAQYCIFT